MDDAARDEQALKAGGIPAAAEARLDALRARGGAFFTSDLTTNEFLLVQRAGFRPLSQVMGSCFYNVGWQWMPGRSTYGAWNTTYDQGETVELETQTEAWNEARRLALSRLSVEARRIDADAVVGVKLRRGAFDWAAGLLEFIAVGTAVKSQRYELGEGPVLSNLSGQQFAALFDHGFWPVGLVASTTVGYVMTGWQQQRGVTGLFSGRQNQELTDFTRGVYDTRTQTMLRLNRQAHKLQAHGIVGVAFEQQHKEHERDAGGVKYTDLVVTIHVVGTAIVELQQKEEQPVYIALPLNEEQR
jgi:uncharacterized protein YbjQ (UPF0145 family)